MTPFRDEWFEIEDATYLNAAGQGVLPRVSIKAAQQAIEWKKFPHRAPEGKGILRCFLGGARDEAVLGLTDEQILETVQRELKDILKLDARPIFARVYRWRGAMAQYEPGHIARVERIEKRVAEIPGLALAGNAYHGIGVPDCIRSGMNAANSLVRIETESLSPQLQ